MKRKGRCAVYPVAWLVVCLFLAPVFSRGQTEADLKFSSLTTTEGLSQNSVNCILKDKYGFMWFGTRDGLNRWDGNSFSIYRNDPKDPGSLPDNQVSCLFEDDQALLWIGTMGRSLCIYDRSRDIFLRPEDLGFHSDGPIDPAILCMHEDRQGYLWVGTYRGLLLIDRKKKTIRHFLADPAKPTALNNATIQTVLEDSAGRLWVGSYHGLHLFDRTTQTFTRFLHDPADPHSITSDKVMALAEDRYGRLEIGTDDGGLNYLDIHDLPSHPDPHKTRFSCFSRSGGPEDISSNSIRALCRTPDGHLWVGTEKGLCLMKDSSHFDQYHKTQIGEGSLTSNTILSLFEDKAGILWVGTSQGGVNKYDRNLFYFGLYRHTADPNSLSGDEVTSFAADTGGNIYIGTDGNGLDQWQRSTGRFLHYHPSPGKNSLAADVVLSLLPAKNQQQLWIGTYGNGLDRMDLRTKRFTHIAAGPGPDKLSNPSVYALLEDGGGNLWIGTNGGGVNVLRPDGTIIKHRSAAHPDSLSNDYIRCLLEDRSGRIWIGTYSGGISVYDPGTGKFTGYNNVVNHLSNQVVFSLFQDANGRIWAGTMGGGLDLFDAGRQQFITFNEMDGLANNIVNSITQDSRGYLWLSTNKGISRLDPATRQFRNYGIFNGLQNLEFINGSGYRSPDGRIFFGGIDGFNVFDPLEVRENRIPPVTRFTGFFLFGKPVRPDSAGSPLKGDINRVKELTLSYDQSDFSIGYAALNYTVASGNRYDYMLEGFNKEWQQAGAGRSATYTNLPPGHYTFKVRAANNDGVWNRQPTTLTIIVQPPLWKTWWAYTSYLILLLILLFVIYKDITGRERLRSQVRIERLTAEKTVELNDIKLNFFTQVSHELRTPLSLILDPLRKMIREDMSREQTRNYSRLMYDNAQRLTRLIDQMLDWRKLETGHLRLNARPANMVALTRNITDLFANHADERHIRYSVAAESENILVMLDTDKFEKIIFNLISNAFKYTPDNGNISIFIRKGNEVTIGACAEVHVTDTGVGIAADQKQKVFGLFYQVEDSGRYENGSTGIGLALASQLAQLHLGKIDLESQQGKGSEFILYLPLAGGGAASAGAGAASAGAGVAGVAIAAEDSVVAVHIAESHDFALPDPAPNDAAASDDPAITIVAASDPDDEPSPLILLVEDNNDLRRYVKDELSALYKVADTPDGSSGFTTALQLVPDLIISDIMMPGISGLELCNKVKSDHRTSHIPVILLTARQSDAHQLEGYTAGADLYIPKPFNMEVVLACVKNLLESRRRLRELYESDPGSALPAIQRNPLDKAFLEKAAAVVASHLSDHLFDIDQLAAGLKISRRQLYRKLKALTNQTAHDFITNLRMDKAAGLLLTGEYSISEVAYQVGYSEPANFTRSFTRKFGKSPRKYVADL
ncbi:MAG TPA: two-component regulator propeller domain-containing protein [Puia sp.]